MTLPLPLGWNSSILPKVLLGEVSKMVPLSPSYFMLKCRPLHQAPFTKLEATRNFSPAPTHSLLLDLLMWSETPLQRVGLVGTCCLGDSVEGTVPILYPIKYSISCECEQNNNFLGGLDGHEPLMFSPKWVCSGVSSQAGCERLLAQGLCSEHLHLFCYLLWAPSFSFITAK